MQRLAILALLFLPLTSIASCPKHSFTEPAKVKLSGHAVMIVTHASSNDDGRIVSKFGVDEAVHFAKKNHIPVIYLQDDRPEERYFMEDCNPDYWVFSKGGEIQFDVAPTHVYLAGGHLEMCLSNTVHDILMSWAKNPKRNLKVSYFMDGIFSNGKYIEESDPYYRDYIRFMGIVNYARPAGEYFPKLTLLESMGIILNESRQYDFLKRTLPHYERTLPGDYRVELNLRGSSGKYYRGQKARRSAGLRAGVAV